MKRLLLLSAVVALCAWLLYVHGRNVVLNAGTQRIISLHKQCLDRYEIDPQGSKDGGFTECWDEKDRQFYVLSGMEATK